MYPQIGPEPVEYSSLARGDGGFGHGGSGIGRAGWGGRIDCALTFGVGLGSRSPGPTELLQKPIDQY